MDNLKNTLSINIIILIIAILFIFTLYIVKDYNSDNQDSIDLSSRIFKKYKGHKDDNFYKNRENSISDNIISDKKDKNIMKEDFFIKKKVNNEDIYLRKLNKKNESIIFDLKKKNK